MQGMNWRFGIHLIVAHYNAQCIWVSPAAVRLVYTDASDSGYGGYTVEHVAQGSWLPEDAAKSSIKLQNMRVRWFSDNQNVVRILEVGSGQPHLQAELMKIVEVCMQHNIRMEPGWVPRDENRLADYISRIVDLDDWQLDSGTFRFLDGLRGPCTVDRFADNYNAQLIRFNSRYACPGTEAVDVFTVHWGEENNWWCPPPGLVVRVIRHAEACNACGTLTVPCRKSAPFWPLLCLDGVTFASFVAAVCELPLSQGLFHPGRTGGILFGRKYPNTPVLALRLGFRCGALWACNVRLVEPAVDRGVNGTQKACVSCAATWLARSVVEWYLVTVD